MSIIRKAIFKEENAVAEEENVNSEQENADSERFNSMLSAAKKQVGSDGGSSNLTQSQIEAMLAVNDDDEEEEDDEKESDNDGEEPSGEEGEEEPGQSEGSEDGKKKKKAKKSKKEKKPKEKKERKPINKVLLARVLTLVGVLVAGAAGFVLSLIMFGDLLKSSEEQFAIKCANALNSRLTINTKLSVYKAYVRNGASADICMLYAVTSLGDKDKTDMYRIVVSHDDPNTINMYYTLDENSADYQRLLNSEKGEERVQASLLKTYSDEIYACDFEIRSGPTDWKRVDSVIINKNITSSQK